MSYLGYDIFPFDATSMNSPVHEIKGNYNRIGNSFAKQTVVKYRDQNDYYSLTFFLSTLSERKTLEDFFDSKFGRYGYFWLPSFKKDMKVKSANVGNSFDIEYSGYSDSTTDYSSLWYVIMPDESDFCAKISTIIRKDTNTETVTLDSVPATGVNSGTYINLLNFVRFDQDDISFSFLENDHCTVSFKFKNTRGTW